MFKHPAPKRTILGCLSGLAAGLIFVAPAIVGQAQETAPSSPADPTLQVAESLLNQEPKPQPVMRHREEVPASAVAPARTPRAYGQALSPDQTGAVRKAKQKKRKSKATAPAASASSPRVKANPKPKGEPAVKTKKAAKKTPAKSSRRKAQKSKTR